MALKKAGPKKAAQKKSIPEKAASKKTATKKVKTRTKKAIPKKTILPGEIAETPTTGDCMCKQKRLNGKYFCFRLVQGRWVQSSAVPFPTQELCEEACC